MRVRRPIPLVSLLPICTLICSAQVANSHAVGVQVVNGVGEFYLRSDAGVFVPRGNNYIRLAQQTHLPGYGGTFTYHSLFNVGLYDTADVETVLTEMQADGYNTVRVFLNECCSGGIGSPYGGLSYMYLANVTDFLNRAKSHGLAVLVTGEWIPETGGYSDWVTPVANITGTNAFFLTAGGAQAYAKYWSDIVNGLAAQNAPFDAVLAWEVQNELYFDSTSPPLSLTSGTVTTGDGGTYDMSNAASRQSMMDNNLVYFIGQVRSAIVAVDPTALVTVSFFVPQTPNATRVGDTRLISTEPAICCSTADFIDLHPYIGNLTLAQMVQNFGSAGLTAKPLLMGEFGAAQSMATDAQTAAAMFQQWQVQSCSLGFDGWLLWNWDLTNTVDANYWTAMADNGEIDGALRPSTRPNACQAGSYPNEDLSFGATATASASLAANPPVLAVDGNPGTSWSAGAFAPQWIEIALPTPSTVSGVNLTVGQYPSGPTVHDLYVQIQGGQPQLVTEFSGTTQDQQVLSWTAATPIANVSSIKVQTVSSPSWVAWREIEVLSAATSQTISFNPLSNVNYGVAPFTVSATAGSGLPVSFASTSAAVCTVSGNTVTVISGGLCSIVAIQMGNATYDQAATVTQSFTVNQLSQTISFDAIPNQILGISPFPIAAQSSALLPVAFTSTTPAVCRISDDLVMLLSAGTCSITASQAGNASYSAATSAMRSFTVSQAKPSGSFMAAPGSPFTAGTAATSMAAGDFNGDGVPDFAIVGFATDTVTVLLGNGSGGFKPAAGSPITVGVLPQSVVTGDFNGDGFQDLALSNPNGGNIVVLLGDGSGGFRPATGSPFSSGPGPVLVVGDFNGDGIQDLAEAGENGTRVLVMLGNGSGGFTLSGGYSSSEPDSIAVGDFNGDGIEDLVTANTASQSLTVLLGNRALGFLTAAGSGDPILPDPTSVAVGDFNGDGIQDLAVANESFNGVSGGGSVSVLLGNGTGGFTEVPSSPFTAGTTPRSIVVGDFNGDGIQDIATANSQSNDVTVLLGNGSGGFTAAPGSPFAVGTTPLSLVVGDFNGDGIEDLATTNYGSNDVSVLLGFAAGNTSQTITFGPLSNVTFGVGPLAISAAGTSGLPVSFASTTPAVCTVSGNAVTIVGGGTCTIVASQAGNATYAAAYTVTQSFTVNPGSQTITFGPLSDQVLNSSPTLSATASSGLGVTFASNSTQVCYVSGSEVGLLGPGTCSITASQTGNASWSAAMPVTQTFTVSAFGIQPAAGFLDLYGAPALTFNDSTNFPDAGGLLIRAPGVTQDLSGNVYVLGLDSAGGVHLNSYNFETASWNGWQYSGGILDTTSGLTAAVAPNGIVWFTGRDIGNRYWINSWNGTTFGGWILVADGIFAADSVPQIAIPSDGSIYVIGKDIGGRIWSNSYNLTSQTFTGWVDRQAVMIGQPSATAGQDGMVYVAVRSTASNSPVYITQIPAQNASTANTWINGGGLIDTDPQITSQGGTVYLMAEAGNNTVYLLTFAEATQTFGAWSFTNGVLNDATIAAAAGNVYIAGRDSADRIYWYSVTGNGWFFAGGAGISSTVLTGGK